MFVSLGMTSNRYKNQTRKKKDFRKKLKSLTKWYACVRGGGVGGGGRV